MFPMPVHHDGAKQRANGLTARYGSRWPFVLISMVPDGWEVMLDAPLVILPTLLVRLGMFFQVVGRKLFECLVHIWVAPNGGWIHALSNIGL